MEKRRAETRIPFPLLPPLTWCSGRHRCYPRGTAQPLILLPLPLPRYKGYGWEPKWWCVSGGDTCRTRPPTPRTDGSLAPKMPDSVPPPRKRRHPSRIPRLPFAAGGGGVGGAPKKNARGTSHSSLHRFVFRHFPVTLNHRRPQRRLSPPGPLAYGKKRSAEEDTLPSIPPATACG